MSPNSGLILGLDLGFAQSDSRLSSETKERLSTQRSGYFRRAWRVISNPVGTTRATKNGGKRALRADRRNGGRDERERYSVFCRAMSCCPKERLPTFFSSLT